FAKSIAGGFPLAGVGRKAEYMDAIGPAGLGGTYAGNPLACAAALAVMEVFDEDDLRARSRQLGAHWGEALQALQTRERCIAEVRGLRAMVALELCEDGVPRRPASALTSVIVSLARDKGLILLACGNYGNVLRILVPL